jgi:translation initiation factor 2-alpha kinase 4
LHFRAVKLFHPRHGQLLLNVIFRKRHFTADCLGTVYQAEPVCDDIAASLPLELHMVTFDAHYYTTHQGRKKLKLIQEEVQRLIGIHHENVIRLYAVKLTLPQSSGAPQLAVLMEQKPQLTLHDLLEDCETLREERASVRE